MTRNIKYPITFDNSKRVFFEFDLFVRFFEKNKHSVKNVKIKPAKMGADNFGSVEVLLKK